MALMSRHSAGKRQFEWDLVHALRSEGSADRLNHGGGGKDVRLVRVQAAHPLLRSPSEPCKRVGALAETPIIVLAVG